MDVFESGAPQLYAPIFDVLDDAKVRTPKDLLPLRASVPVAIGLADREVVSGTGRVIRTVGGAPGLDSRHHSWVVPLYEAIQTSFDPVLALCAQRPGPRIVSERLFSPLMVRRWHPGDRVFSVRANLAALFPARVLFLGHQLVCWEGSPERWVPADYLSLLLNLRPALERGACHLLPIRVRRLAEPFDDTLHSAYDHYTTEADITIPASGERYSDIVARVGDAALVTQDPVLAFPRLRGASLIEQFDLVERHAEAYGLYLQALDRFVRGRTADETLLREWLLHLADECDRLDGLMNLERRRLAARGRDVAVGLAVTLATLLAPSQIAALTAVLGTASVVEGLKWIRARQGIAEHLAGEDMWIAWQLLERSQTGEG